MSGSGGPQIPHSGFSLGKNPYQKFHCPIHTPGPAPGPAEKTCPVFPIVYYSLKTFPGHLWDHRKHLAVQEYWDIKLVI